MGKKVVMVGWHPSALDYTKYPGLTPEKLEASLRADEAALRGLGYDARIAFVRDAGGAPSELEALLRADEFDVVLIGAGVRRDEAHFLLFERLVNTVHEHAPKARIAFNTGPTDSTAAIQRWA
jgi:hypothetical protein